jgi:hypothetical protein
MSVPMVIGAESMNGITCSVGRCIVGLILVSFVVLAATTISVNATEVFNENDYPVPAYEVRHFSVYLAEDAGMAGWFRINNGDGIHFFIVDEFGHSEVQSTGSATTAYKVTNYPRAEGNWYYWNFIAPDTDTWYVYFSNALGTAYAGVSDELDIIIRTDTEAPSIQTSSVLNSVHGPVAIDFTATDDCFPVEKVELYVDNVLIDTKTNPNTETGYIFSGTFEWRSYEWDDGNHTVFLRAYDTLGKAENYHFPGQVVVANDWLDYPVNQTILFAAMAIVIVAIVCFVCTRK